MREGEKDRERGINDRERGINARDRETMQMPEGKETRGIERVRDLPIWG